MPSFLRRGPRIEMEAAGKCCGKRRRREQKLGDFFKDVMRRGRASFWPVYNLAHVNSGEAPMLSVVSH